MFVIINCDDFGMDEHVNCAVHEACIAGQLSSATLLVDGPAVDHAVSIARECPELGVGLHLNLDEFLGFGADGFYGHTLSNVNPQQYVWAIEHLSDIERRIDDQFARFASLGIRMSHVDGHHHAHLLPRIFESVLSSADKYEVRRIRFFRSFYEGDWYHCNEHISLLRRYGFKYASDFRDFSHLEFSDVLDQGSTEIMVHISTKGPGSEDWRAIQMERLASTEMKTWLEAYPAYLINYSHL